MTRCHRRVHIDTVRRSHWHIGCRGITVTNGANGFIAEIVGYGRVEHRVIGAVRLRQCLEHVSRTHIGFRLTGAVSDILQGEGVFGIGLQVAEGRGGLPLIGAVITLNAVIDLTLIFSQRDTFQGDARGCCRASHNLGFHRRCFRLGGVADDIKGFNNGRTGPIVTNPFDGCGGFNPCY